MFQFMGYKKLSVRMQACLHTIQIWSRKMRSNPLSHRAAAMAKSVNRAGRAHVTRVPQVKPGQACSTRCTRHPWRNLSTPCSLTQIVFISVLRLTVRYLGLVLWSFQHLQAYRALLGSCPLVFSTPTGLPCATWVLSFGLFNTYRLTSMTRVARPIYNFCLHAEALPFFFFYFLGRVHRCCTKDRTASCVQLRSCTVFGCTKLFHAFSLDYFYWSITHTT